MIANVNKKCRVYFKGFCGLINIFLVLDILPYSIFQEQFLQLILDTLKSLGSGDLDLGFINNKYVVLNDFRLVYWHLTKGQPCLVLCLLCS